jgi:hypothetical protein
MWALLDRDNETVLACIPPSVTFDKMLSTADGRTTILMTFENSPAYVGGKYINGKFYEMTQGDK